MCIRTHDLLEKSGITLRGVMRCGTSESPPWKSVRPQVDLSLSDIRKGDLHPLESRSRAVEHISSYEGFTASYTDGSKTEAGTGCAFVCGRDTRSFSLPGHSSVFSAELVAIYKTLCFIEVSHEALHLILSDSLSSLLALRSFYPCNPLIQDILTHVLHP